MLADAGICVADSTHRYHAPTLDGADIFLTYCAGCHGFDGFADYRPAPSFAMGDRLQKSDDELLESVLRGKGAMPPWEDKLSVPVLQSAIRYLRVMHARLDAGLPPRERGLPDYYFRFRPIDETGSYQLPLQDE